MFGKMKNKAVRFVHKLVTSFAPELKLDRDRVRYLVEKKYLDDSAEYIVRNMPRAQVVVSRHDLYEYIKPHVKEGNIIEMGVAEGASINYFANLFQDRNIYGFDSFEGFPDDGILPKASESEAIQTTIKFHVGKVGLEGKVPVVEDNVEIHKGWFTQTLPLFTASLTDKIALLHIDCDIYSSTIYSLESLKKYLQPSTIIIFDEYLGYRGWPKHEYGAFQDFVKQHGIKYEYLVYTYAGQVAVRLIEV